MNPTSDHLDDEVISALLDGDAATEPDAAAHLGACDRCAARQAELAGARAALAAAPVEGVVELTRRRLVAAALAAAEASPAAGAPAATPLGRSRWARRHPALVGSAAAAVLAVLVGVPFVVGNDRSGGHETLAAQAPGQNPADSFLGDLGDLSDRDRLRLRLSGAAPSDTYAAPAEAGPSSAAGAPAPAPFAASSPAGGGVAGSANELAATTTMPPLAGRTAAPQTGSGSASASKAAPEAAKDSASADQGFSGSQGYSGDQAGRDRADTDACVAALLNGPARGGRLNRAGTGTYRGRPAIVASFELSGGTEAFITDRSGCAVLDRFSM